MSAYQFETCKCDLCGSDQYHVMHDKKYDSPPITMIRDDGIPVHTIDVMCKECGLVYKNPRMTRESLDKFYTEQYRETYVSKETSEEFHANIAYRLLDGMSGSLLDIGCSKGKLLELWQGESAGVEPSQLRPPNAYASIKDVPKQYDIVTMLNALEHMYSPTETLQEIYKVCGGHLLLSVPDLFNTNIKIGVSPYLSCAHLYTFYLNTIEALLVKCGFTPQKIIYANEEIGNKLYILSQKDIPREPVFFKPDVRIVTAFLNAWDTLMSIKIYLSLQKGGQ